MSRFELCRKIAQQTISTLTGYELDTDGQTIGSRIARKTDSRTTGNIDESSESRMSSGAGFLSVNALWIRITDRPWQRCSGWGEYHVIMHKKKRKGLLQLFKRIQRGKVFP